MKILFAVVIALFATAVVHAADYLRCVRFHLDRVVGRSVDGYGPEHTQMWLAAIDATTGRLPTEPLPRELRWYRKITLPEGSNLYWDQSTILAAYTLSDLTQHDRYAAAADVYLRDFLRRCVAARSGLFLWENHVYYDVVRDEVAAFGGGYHECRPHTPAWELFWKQDPKATERAIRAMGRAHIKDQASGRFCRHADWRETPGVFAEGEAQGAKPFLEAGASLIDSLCWLADKTGDDDGKLTQMALQAARYSYAQRDTNTGLLRNQPIDRRWDYYASTTEVGLWAAALIRAGEYTGNEEFLRMSNVSTGSPAGTGLPSFSAATWRRIAWNTAPSCSSRSGPMEIKLSISSRYDPCRHAGLKRCIRASGSQEPRMAVLADSMPNTCSRILQTLITA